MSPSVRIRVGVPADLEIVAGHFFALWSDAPIADHRKEAEAILSGRPPGTMPLLLFVAEVDGHVVGFVEVGLRSHADGCDTAQPVGFVEGWYVEPEYRRQGVGRSLIRAAEEWARSKGCHELARYVDRSRALAARPRSSGVRDRRPLREL